ncbi:hypothetical protein BU17DRAFT_56965 [Hysterangium stoloniferum]|nr:hypothetical protein BU17DRAFT_56965 [Hysterangium stoloniferum]
MSDPFTHSRSHYQPGFLMVRMGNCTCTPPGGQNIEEPPIIPTKFNPSASRSSPSEFGLESMFERTKSRRSRQPTRDEDAPPTTSINDMVDEPHINPFQRRDTPTGSPPTSRRQPQPVQTSQPSHVIYLNVFGYPLDRYESVAKSFKSFGDTTEPEPSENGMWFTIGFRQAWEAERALRRNGKVMDDSYMIGVARAVSPTLFPLVRLQLTAIQNGSMTDVPIEGPRPGGVPGSPPQLADPATPAKDSLVPAFSLGRSSTNSVGTPVTLVPSAAAFKTPSARPKPSPQHTPQTGVSEGSTLSKISDMVFGW